MYNRLHTIPACDGQTPSYSILRAMQTRGKISRRFGLALPFCRHFDDTLPHLPLLGAGYKFTYLLTKAYSC